MIISESKDGKINMVVYQNSVLCLSKEDTLTFNIDNEHLKYKIHFSFSTEGENFTSKKWETPEDLYLHFQLNNWDSTTFVEVINPYKLKIPDSKESFFLKFRNFSVETKNFRKFEITIWKEVKDGN